MSNTQEKVKGRARINFTDELVELLPFDVQKPVAGEVMLGIIEAQPLLDTWQSFLLLPEGYTVIGVFFDVSYYTWVIVIESHAIPLPPKGDMIPLLSPLYERTADGKVRFVDLKKELLETYGKDNHTQATN